MEIIGLQIQNFLTIKEAFLELDNRGLLLIQGTNMDDTSANSNGSGKSSIVDALSWAIYGTTARGEGADAIVNDVVGKDTCVCVELFDDGNRYLIERYRKHKVHKNQLHVHALATDETRTPLHKGKENETQLVIDKIMGCTHEVFVGSIYAGQEKMPDLPGMTDKFLKLLVEEAAGVSELAECYDMACKAATNVEKLVAVARTHAANAQQRAVMQQQSVEEAQQQEKLFNDTRRDRARDELAKIPPLAQAQQDGAKELAAIDVAALNASKADLEAQLASHRDVQQEHNRLVNAAAAANTTAEREKTTLTHLKRAFDQRKAELAGVLGRVGAACGECGKQYCEHDMDTAKALAEEAVARAEKAQNDHVQITRNAIAAAKTAADAVAAHHLPDVSAVSAELRRIADILTTVQRLEQALKNTDAQIVQIKEAATAKLNEPNPWSPHVASRQAAYSEAKALEDDAANKAIQLEAEYETIAAACKVFGPAGVRAHILDTVTPFLNAQTGEYLSVMSDGNISATWSTLTRNAKGELKEKFSIQVENSLGGKSFGLQSGGEKRKVRLATALALQDLQASRASKPIGLFMADEIDDALDSPGIERLMTVLEKKARDRGTVLVISHNDMKDWIDNVITVTKQGRLSTVGGASTR